MTINPEMFYRPSAAELKVIASTSTLAKWRCFNTGPKYVKSGSTVLYRGRDVLAWLEANTVETVA